MGSGSSLVSIPEEYSHIMQDLDLDRDFITAAFLSSWDDKSAVSLAKVRLLSETLLFVQNSPTAPTLTTRSGCATTTAPHSAPCST